MNELMTRRLHTLAAEESGRPCIPSVTGSQVRGEQLRMRTWALAHAFPGKICRTHWAGSMAVWQEQQTQMYGHCGSKHQWKNY